jgi:hypothetical protein
MVTMKGAMSGKSENMKQSRLMNFSAIPLERKDSEPNVSSEIDEMTEVTHKEARIPVLGTFSV